MSNTPLIKQFAPTLWTKSVTVGAQSLRPPIDWDIIPTQVPYQGSRGDRHPPYQGSRGDQHPPYGLAL
ncbi:MAG: hypothetical protein EWV60_17380 [Microcystis sp. Msp_OC_L_20101000_S702]|nr:MAG: hypothetical protein EWV60_17380 [Microcystis sp. Msp_OC_L_20101000_S702]